MFTWICPKCGSEVPPSENDCPNCRAKAKASQTQSASPVVAPPTSPPSPAVQPEAQAVAATPNQPVIVPPPFRSPDQAPLPPAGGGRKSSLSPALVAVATAVGIVALLAVLYLFVLPSGAARHSAGGAPATTLENPGTASPGATRPNVATAHPLAKYIEVTGVRVAEAGAGQTRIIVAAVNHSAADLPELDAHLTLSGGGKTVFDFPVTIPSIGPYESKDVATVLKTHLKPYEMPDWQTLSPALRIVSER